MARRKRIVGTAGHIDHGKTALVRAMTGIDTDRLPEEKKRGITIDLGFASWFTDDYQIGFIDVPGHERFVKNMLAGIGGIDSALLVVAAGEAVKPPTRGHFALCRLPRIPPRGGAVPKRELVHDDNPGLGGRAGGGRSIWPTFRSTACIAGCSLFLPTRCARRR